MGPVLFVDGQNAFLAEEFSSCAMPMFSRLTDNGGESGGGTGNRSSSVRKEEIGRTQIDGEIFAELPSATACSRCLSRGYVLQTGMK